MLEVKAIKYWCGDCQDDHYGAYCPYCEKYNDLVIPSMEQQCARCLEDFLVAEMDEDMQ